MGGDLREHARNIRKLILKSIYLAGSGHPGASLSITDIVTALMFEEMNWLEFKEKKANWRNTDIPRDRFVLSKGHGIPAWYATLTDAGIISKEELYSLRKFGSPLQGHPDRVRFQYIDSSGGALGQGLSVAIGRAIGLKSKQMSCRVYCIIGDGESQEGQIWEAAMFAPNKQVDNLLCIIDHNKYQQDGRIEDIMPLGSFPSKWKAFGWNVLEIDGHNFTEILTAFRNARETKRKPTAIIAHTLKGNLGNGQLFMKGLHAGKIDKDSYENAMEMLENGK